MVTSRDLYLSWEAKPVAQAVDMLIGQRAQVFIGNGVRSSFDIVHVILIHLVPVLELNI